MDIKYSDKIEFEKELNNLDKFAIAFTQILNESKINYALVSGYVSILFGRNRASEDIDLIIEKISPTTFQAIWKKITNEFECLNTDNAEQAYSEYLLTGTSLRFSRKKEYLPNMEIKFPKNDLDIWTIENRKEVKLNSNTLYISPLELQIPFKLWLGTQKDIEDARYLYKIFKNDLNTELLTKLSRQLKIQDKLNGLLQ